MAQRTVRREVRRQYRLATRLQRVPELSDHSLKHREADVSSTEVGDRRDPVVGERRRDAAGADVPERSCGDETERGVQR